MVDAEVASKLVVKSSEACNKNFLRSRRVMNHYVTGEELMNFKTFPKIYAFGLHVATAFLLLLMSPPTHANLVINGDFSNGYSGFSSQYGYADSSTTESRFGVTSNPRNFHPSGASFGDHTSGQGLMLVANGATKANVFVWQQTFDLLSNTDYSFSGWVSSWGNFGDATDPSPSRLNLLIDGVVLGNQFFVPAANGQWDEFQYSFTTGTKTAITLSLISNNTAGVGNDFVLDDLSLSSVPEPGSLALWALALGALVITKRKQAA
jgi:hypothetical protein